MSNIHNLLGYTSGYPRFRTYAGNFKHQRYVQQILIAEKKLNNISDLEREVQLWIPTQFGKKLVFLDFVVEKNGKLGIIEVDGIQHYQYVPKFHKNGYASFIKQQNRDRIVNKYAKDQQIKILRLNINTSIEDPKSSFKSINQINKEITNFIQKI